MAWFFNSRATHVQSPIVTLIVKNKRKLKKCLWQQTQIFECENRLILSVSDRPENSISFCIKRVFYVLKHFSRSVFFTFYAMIMFIAQLFLLFS